VLDCARRKAERFQGATVKLAFAPAERDVYSFNRTNKRNSLR
jgi:hypothetical protein